LFGSVHQDAQTTSSLVITLLFLQLLKSV